MSNLIKSAYFNVVAQESRVIDSDEKIPVLIPEILQQQGKNAALPSVEQPEADLQAASLEEEFQSGLNVVNMDDLLQQEKRKCLRSLRNSPG